MVAEFKLVERHRKKTKPTKFVLYPVFERPAQ